MAANRALPLESLAFLPNTSPGEGVAYCLCLLSVLVLNDTYFFLIFDPFLLKCSLKAEQILSPLFLWWLMIGSSRESNEVDHPRLERLQPACEGLRSPHTLMVSPFPSVAFLVQT